MESTTPTLEELLKKPGIVPATTAPSSPRAKMLAQADRMLTELKKYKATTELNGKSTKYWWAPQAVNGKRRVSVRYENKVVEGCSTYVNDDLDAVRKAVEAYKAVIDESDDATWAPEEARRKSSK